MAVETNEAYNVSEFKITPGAVTFNGVKLGGTDGPVNISAEYTYYESKCNQAGEQILAKIVTSVKYKIKAKFKQIDKALVAALGTEKKVTSALIGTDLYAKKAVLSISEIRGTLTHTFAAAVVLPESLAYAVDGTSEHGVELEFEATAGAGGAIYAVSDSATPVI